MFEGVESARKQVDPTIPRKQTCTEIGMHALSNVCM